MINKDLVIIGGGAAGMSAALSAKRNGIDDILVIEKDKELGGVLNQCIHNGFGLHYFKEDLTGTEYSFKLIKQLQESNIEVLLNTFVLSLDKDKTITVSNKDGILKIKAKSIILSTGCREKNIGEIKIPGSRPSGIFTAGLVQEALNKDDLKVGTEAVILGSGDIGLIMARRLHLNGINVKAILEIKPMYSGLRRNIVQCAHDFDIPLYLNTTITNIVGENRLEKIVISKVDNNGEVIPNTEETIKCDTLITAIGLTSNIKLPLKCNLDLSDKDRVLVDKNLQSSIDGIFVCGNLLRVHSLVDFASEEGEKAGENIAKYLMNKDLGYSRELFEPEEVKESENKCDNKSEQDKYSLVCINCPKGCIIKEKLLEDCSVIPIGYACEKGKEFYINEKTDKRRILTAAVKINSKQEMLPVKTDKPVKIEDMFNIIEKLKKIKVSSKVKMNQQIAYIPTYDVNIISCKEI